MKKILYVLALSLLTATPFSAHAEIVGSGTAADPYQIASAEDLCNAWTHVSGMSETEYYFIQTADIDMAGHTDWHAISGHSGLYASIVHYDGQKHVIKNFCPANNPMVADGSYYYCTSLFGVVSGKIRNLGIIDAEPDFSTQGVGILAAYGGHNQGGSLTINNVFVTGEIKSNGRYTGGMRGINGSNVTMTNSYANVTVSGGTYTAGLVGCLDHTLVAENVYIAGYVSSTSETVALVASGRGRGTYDGLNVIAFNTGVTQALESAIEVVGEPVSVATAETNKNLIAEIQKWTGFRSDKLFKGYPALNWQKEVDPDGTKENPYEIATAEDFFNVCYFASGSDYYHRKYYFVQTADIDMAGHTDLLPFSGNKEFLINYDGRNHIIKNFRPEDKYDIPQYAEYYEHGSLFGRVSGEIKNLGVLDAYIVSNDNHITTAGIIATYGGSRQPLTIDSVFVTGYVKSTSHNAGGMIGHPADTTYISNSYANVTVDGKIAGGLIGTIGRNDSVSLENVYVAGTVKGENACLVANTYKDYANSGGTINANNVVAFNAGSSKVININVEFTGNIDVANDLTKDKLIAEIGYWAAFNESKLFNGLPALNWQSGEGIDSKLKYPSFDYNGRFLSITSPDSADIYFSENDGEYDLYSGRFDVGGLQSFTAFARKADYRDSAPLQFKVTEYGKEKTAMVGSDGSLENAFKWTASGEIDRWDSLKVTGYLKDIDYQWLRERKNLINLDLGEIIVDSSHQIPYQALGGTNLVTVTMPSSVDDMSFVGDAIFNNNTELSAVTWKTGGKTIPLDVLLTNLENQDANNPNMLLYSDDSNSVKELTGLYSNIVINGIAEKIDLSEAGPWHCPHPFIAANVNYTHEFTKPTAIDGGSAGWEMIALPFDVQEVSHEKGRLFSFAEIVESESADALRYWLYIPVTSGWQSATTIKANTPYLIAMPNNRFYSEQFNVAGSVVFRASNVSIAETPSDLSHAYRNGYQIVANYKNINADSGRLAVNDDETEGEAPGSVFAASGRNIRSFEAYLTAPGQSRVPIFNTSAVTEGLMAETSLKIWSDTPQSVSVSAPFNASVNIYDISGRIIRTVNVVGGQTVRITDLPAGIYIIAKNKIAIRR